MQIRVEGITIVLQMNYKNELNEHYLRNGTDCIPYERLHRVVKFKFKLAMISQKFL